MKSGERVSAPDDGADHPKMEPGTWMAFREQGKVPIPLGVLLRGPSCHLVDHSFYPRRMQREIGVFLTSRQGPFDLVALI